MTQSPTTLDLDPPARELVTLVAGVTDDQLSASTPCAEYSVGDLLDHLVGLTQAFTDAATKSPPPGGSTSPPPRGSTAHLDPAWRTLLPARLAALVAAWRDPAAWQGTMEAGGVRLPAEVMGTVVVGELVLHGWDLAGATGQPFSCDAGSTQACLEFTASMSEPGQEAGRDGLFGPVVDVPPDAPPLERALGLSGRDPAWTRDVGPHS